MSEIAQQTLRLHLCGLEDPLPSPGAGPRRPQATTRPPRQGPGLSRRRLRNQRARRPEAGLRPGRPATPAASPALTGANQSAGRSARGPPTPPPLRPKAARIRQGLSLPPPPARTRRCHIVENVTALRARPQRPPLAAVPPHLHTWGAGPGSAVRPLAAASVALFT